MNPFLGLEIPELVAARDAFIHRRAALDGSGRGQYAALLDAIDDAAAFMPLPEHVGELSVEAVENGPDDPADVFEVAIVERPRDETGAEWAYAVVRFEFTIDDDEARAVEGDTFWVHDGFGFGDRAPCSIYGTAHSAALAQARWLADEAADAWLEDRREARREALAEERAE